LMIVGLLLGLLGAALVFMYVRNLGSGTATEGQTVATYVADEAIIAGTPGASIAELVRTTEVPERYAPEGAIFDLGQIEGAFSTEQIDAGETLRASMFSEAGATEGGRLAIPEGMEGVAVTTSLQAGVAQYLAPGDHVNVFVTFREDKTTHKILSNITVLATQAASTNSAAQLSGSNPNELVFVLAVSPKDASRLVFAKELGSIWMTLVPQGQRSPKVRPVGEGSFGLCPPDDTSPGCSITEGGA
jgi:pilus assembly protein CpaB